MIQETVMNILLVEDDPGDAGLVRRALKDVRFGRFAVTWATTLAEARAFLAEAAFDAVLLDVRLPDSDGQDTVRAGLALTGAEALVVLTGRDDEDFALRMLDLGAQDYLVKGGLDADALGRSLRHSLARAGVERALRKSEAEHRMLLDTIQTQIWYLTDEQTYGLVNQAHAAFLGRRKEDLCFQDMQSLFSNDVVAICRQGNAAVFSTGHPVRTEEWVPNGAGQLRLLSIWKRPKTREDGSVEYVVCSAEDITEQKRDRDRLQEYDGQVELKNRDLDEALVRAEAASQTKGLFLANMSHELRTPLNAILGFAQILERAPGLPPELAGHARTIARSGKHLLQMLNDLLEMSKVETDQIRLTPETFSLRELLDDLEIRFRARASAKGIFFDRILDADLPETVHGDRTKLRHVLASLLGNAVKFTSQGRVELRVARIDRSNSLPSVPDHAPADKNGQVRVCFEVLDTGPGVPAADLAGLFQPFPLTRSGEQTGGVGLGLAISRRFAELMGGTLTCASEPGQGSRFRLETPLAPAECPPPRVRPRPGRIMGLPPQAGPVRVLAVDDKADNLALFGAMLRPAGFQVREAANGIEALEVFRTWSPHAVLLDMRMPVMDGFEAVRRLKADPAGRNTPVVALTAAAHDDPEEEIMAAGANALLRKPFSPDELLEVLGQCLGLEYFTADPVCEAPDEAFSGPNGRAELKILARQAASGDPQGLARTVPPMRDALEAGDVHRLKDLIHKSGLTATGLGPAMLTLLNRYDYAGLETVLADLEEVLA